MASREVLKMLNKSKKLRIKLKWWEINMKLWASLGIYSQAEACRIKCIEICIEGIACAKEANRLNKLGL